ncbi:MAG TPA: hypothetical protein VIN56_10670, partial [Candidatus Dormibacteraeota bacterium]
KVAARPAAAKAQKYCNAFLKDFADRLHVHQDQVLPALKGSADDSIASAVTAGDLTAAQAAKLKQRVDALKGCDQLASLSSLAPKAGAGSHAGPNPLKLVTTAAAAALQVSPADLQKDVLAGQTLAEIGKTSGVARADFDPAFRAALTAQLDAQVAANKLTKAQETQAVDEAVTMADKLWDKSPKDLGSSFLTGPAG